MTPIARMDSWSGFFTASGFIQLAIEQLVVPAKGSGFLHPSPWP